MEKNKENKQQTTHDKDFKKYISKNCKKQSFLN